MELLLFKKYTLLLFFVFTANSVAAFSSLPEDCPEEFVGKVINVSSLSSSQTPLSKLRIKFSIDANETKFVDIIQGSILKFEEGRNYQVSMRGKFLCEAVQLAF